MFTSATISEVPFEARAFLGAVAAVVVLLFVFFLFLNKKLCFYAATELCNGDQTADKSSKGFALDSSNYKKKENGVVSEKEGVKRSSNLSRVFKQQFYTKGQGLHSFRSYDTSYHQFKQPDPHSQYLIRNPIKSDLSHEVISEDQKDLISLAEKGGVGVEETSANVGVSSSSASSSGSTTSGDDEFLSHRTLRRRDPRAYRQFSPSHSSFHGGFLQDDIKGISEEPLLLHCGSMEVGLSFDLPTKTLTVHVLQAKDIPPNEKGYPPNCQVRLCLLPRRKQKQRTKVRSGENPHFNEAFVFTKITAEELENLALRLRMCQSEKMRREKIIGEVVIPLNSVNLCMASTIWLSMEPRASSPMQPFLEEREDVMSLTRSDSTTSSQSTHSGLPELLLGLSYNGITGQLSVEVVKGSHFSCRSTDDGKLGSTRAPDSYVKLILTSSSGQEIGSAKTSVRRGQPSPLFKETIVFQVALFQLPDVTLMVAAYAKRSIKRKELIGWFALGLNCWGEDEMAHWNAMKETKGEQLCRWHILLES